MSQPSRESASFGKFVGLCLEVNYMNRLSIDDRAAGNTSTRRRETNADHLRNCTPVRGYTEGLLVHFKNGHLVRAAEASRTPDDDLQHWPEFARRSADDLKNLRCRRLLFPRIVQLATKPRGLGSAALWGFRPVASRVSRLAACSGAPSHRPP